MDHIRIQFDHDRKVEARLLAVDVDKGLAVLWANLEPCRRCKSLALVSQIPEEGQRVFTISSLTTHKSLSSGIIMRIDKNAIVPDFNPANLGSPILNMRGEVIGIGGPSHREYNSTKATVTIKADEARELLENAATLMQDAPSPPPLELLPVEPITPYPMSELKNKVDLKGFSTKPYKVDVGKYKITVVTPVLKYYIIEKDRNELARRQAKTKQTQIEKSTHRAASSFYNLRSWAEYVSHVRPVVHVLAMPEVKPTGKSLFFSVLTASMGVFTPFDFKFKADFEEMVLICDGKPISPIHRGKIEYVEPLQNYHRTTLGVAYAGVYTYTSDAFESGRCNQVELQVFSKENPSIPERKLVGAVTIQRVWSDFEVYRQTIIKK